MAFPAGLYKVAGGDVVTGPTGAKVGVGTTRDLRPWGSIVAS